MVKKLTEIRLEQFKQERLKDIRQILIQLQVYINNQELSSEFATNIATDYKQLELEYNRIIDEFNKAAYDY
jgi:ubiquitin-protein ligase